MGYGLLCFSTAEKGRRPGGEGGRKKREGSGVKGPCYAMQPQGSSGPSWEEENLNPV